MIIFVRVKAGSKKEEVTRTDDTHYTLSVKAPPVEGKANEAIIRLLGDHFNVPKSRIRVLKGEKNRNKIIEIL